MLSNFFGYLKNSNNIGVFVVKKEKDDKKRLRRATR